MKNIKNIILNSTLAIGISLLAGCIKDGEIEFEKKQIWRIGENRYLYTITHKLYDYSYIGNPKDKQIDKIIVKRKLYRIHNPAYDPNNILTGNKKNPVETLEKNSEDFMDEFGVTEKYFKNHRYVCTADTLTADNPKFHELKELFSNIK